MASGIDAPLWGGYLDAHIHEIGKLFYSPLCLLVPVYQRPYVWNKEDQWEPLWGDVETLADEVLEKGSAKPHFMGAVVVDFAPGYTGKYVQRSMVVDGQQRLTTIQVLLEALADNYECVRDDGCEEVRIYADRARMITRNHNLADHEPGDEFKVWPMNLDQAAFEAVMTAHTPAHLREVHGDDPKIMNSRIAAAYVFFYECIHDWLHGQEHMGRAAGALYRVIDEYMQVVVIDLQNSVDPQVIFETLNARGTDLTPSDLIKNYLFHQAQMESGDGSDLYATYWQPFEDEYGYWSEWIGKGNQWRPRLDIFVHNYLTMKTRDDVSVKKLYKEYRGFADKTEMNTVDQLAELARYGRVYRSLDYLEPHSREAVFVQRLRAMDIATIMPFVLALKGDNSVSPSDRLEIMGYLESYLVRRMVGGLTGKAYNKVFVELLKATDATGITPQVVRELMLGWSEETNLWPDDVAFRTAWMNNRAYSLTYGRLRMLFDAIEPFVSSDKAEDVAYVLGALTVEHLLPQQWHAYYPLPEGGTIDESERERLLHTFGNLTLLKQKLNSSVSNGRWSTADDLAEDQGKRAKILEHSGLAINRMLARYRAWDETAISERGATLFEAALKVWPRP